jgi:hypothetical protein
MLLHAVILGVAMLQNLYSSNSNKVGGLSARPRCLLRLGRHRCMGVQPLTGVAHGTAGSTPMRECWFLSVASKGNWAHKLSGMSFQPQPGSRGVSQTYEPSCLPASHPSGSSVICDTWIVPVPTFAREVSFRGKNLGMSLDGISIRSRRGGSGQP